MSTFGNFNAADVPVNNDYELITPGEYAATITDSEIRTSKSGKDYVVFTYTLDGPKFGGRKIWDNLMFWHEGEAGRIAHETLAKMCNAVGFKSASEPYEFHGRQMLVKVGIEEGKKGYADKNCINDYKPKAAPPAVGQGQAPHKTGGAPAWATK